MAHRVSFFRVGFDGNSGQIQMHHMASLELRRISEVVNNRLSTGSSLGLARLRAHSTSAVEEIDDDEGDMPISSSPRGAVQPEETHARRRDSFSSYSSDTYTNSAHSEPIVESDVADVDDDKREFMSVASSPRGAVQPGETHAMSRGSLDKPSGCTRMRTRSVSVVESDVADVDDDEREFMSVASSPRGAVQPGETHAMSRGSLDKPSGCTRMRTRSVSVVVTGGDQVVERKYRSTPSSPRGAKAVQQASSPLGLVDRQFRAKRELHAMSSESLLDQQKFSSAVAAANAYQSIMRALEEAPPNSHQQILRTKIDEIHSSEDRRHLFTYAMHKTMEIEGGPAAAKRSTECKRAASICKMMFSK